MTYFQWFSGLSARAAQAAIAQLDLIPVEYSDNRLMFRDDREALCAFEPPSEPHVVLTGNFDNAIHLRRDVASLVADAEHLRTHYSETVTQSMGSLADRQSHPILDRGCLISL